MKRLICSQADEKDTDNLISGGPPQMGLSWMELAGLGSTQSTQHTQSVFLPPMTGSHPLGPSGTDRCETDSCCAWDFFCGGFILGVSRGPLVFDGTSPECYCEILG